MKIFFYRKLAVDIFIFEEKKGLIYFLIFFVNSVAVNNKYRLLFCLRQLKY